MFVGQGGLGFDSLLWESGFGLFILINSVLFLFKFEFNKCRSVEK